jgi:branched-chain amino acid transport system substrate-binding protein
LTDRPDLDPAAAIEKPGRTIMRRPSLIQAGRLLLASAALTAMAATPTRAETGVTDAAILLGTTNPLTGAVGSACKPVSDGALAWFAHVNAEGGVNGRKIEDKVLDDQYQAPQALANARTFMRDGIFAMFGGCGTIQPAAVFPMMQQAGIPYLFPYSALEDFVSPPKKYLFAMLAINRDQISGLIKQVVGKQGPGKMTGLYTKYPGVEEAMAANKQVALAAGASWADGQVITPGGTDFTPIVLRLKEERPDYLILNIVEPDGGRLFKAMQAQNWFPKMMLGTSSLSNGALFDIVGNLLDGKLVTAAPTLPPAAPEAAECVAALKAASTIVNGFSIFGCGTAQAFVHALKQAGPQPTREALVKALDGWKDEMASPVFPPISFSPENHMGQIKMVQLGVVGGKASPEGYFDTPLAPMK